MTRLSLAPLLSIFEVDVVAERWRQLRKWGVQHHPDGTGRAGDNADAVFYRGACDRRFAIGLGTWRDILREEVHEAFAETEYQKLRAELVQVAAVALAWVEDLDSREKQPARLPEIIDEIVDASSVTVRELETA